MVLASQSQSENITADITGSNETSNGLTHRTPRLLDQRRANAKNLQQRNFDRT